MAHWPFNFARRIPVPIRTPWGAWWITSNDAMTRHLLRRDAFEEGEQRFVFQFLQPGMVFLDAGAHHGLYTLLASQKVGPRGRVIAFEPSPRELRRLRWHLAINRCRNVLVDPVALGDVEGASELYVVRKKETGCNSLRPPDVHYPVKRVRVQVSTLDARVQRAGLDRIDMIKLDVEGAELHVLKGATSVIAHYRPIILSEMEDFRTTPWGYKSLQIYESLEGQDYRWFSIRPEGRLQPCPKKDSYKENLLAVPTEKTEQLATHMERGHPQERAKR